MKSDDYQGMMKPIALLLILIGTLLFTPLPGQDIQPAAGAIDQTVKKNTLLEFIRIRSNPAANYVLGPGDIITVDVFGVPELKTEVQVAQDGTIMLPFLSLVRVEGLNTAELQVKLESLLADSVLKDPHVMVSIKEYRSQPVHVLGEISKPGTYQLTHFMRLVDLLSLAGGFTATAGDICTISRQDETGTSQQVEISLVDLLENGNPALNVPVQAGDIIHVPKRVDRIYYVIGDVGKPGAYPIPPKKEIRLSEALTTAGGFTKTSSLANTRLVRALPDGQRAVMAIDFDKILKGSGEDFSLQENDMLYIPNSKAKGISQAMLSSVPNFIYWGLLLAF